MNEEIYNAVADIPNLVNPEVFDVAGIDLGCLPGFTFFVFVAPGKEISEGFKVFANFDIGIEKVFKEVRRYLDCPDGSYAVFTYFADTDAYFYFKTIKHRRKSFALLSDSK